ncbi:family 20 glycosylhydrolase [Novosphingopyxis sp.]|uniref:family 20 glycosylhydrolase n=1 Tax=Novosphingopyxis sp. TaxID=2709690 RepID=UPI003B5C4827
MPLPVALTRGPGALLLRSGAVVAVPPRDPGASAAADLLADWLVRTGGPALVVREASAGTIRFVRRAGLPAEGYALDVTPDGATIAASDDAGLLYGAVTLWQLATQDGVVGTLPAVHVSDAPRFAWRGLMLDSARHYQTPAFIRSLIDAMAANKLNRLHWHLVDDQAWRLEIRKYPLLTQVGGFRAPATAPGAPPLPPTGGVYSQAEVRDLVAYAARRGITIVPEIEMPGHALSAIRAYPALGTGAPIPPGVEAGWGVFPWLFNTEDSTFVFLENVLTEVMELFPSRYIHIGGDEAVKEQWKASPAIQAKMRELGIADENALQGWFIGRIQKYLASHGRRIIGWDEILDDGAAAPGTTIMSWRGTDGAVAAAKAGLDTVLSPAPTLYLDHLQSGAGFEGPGRGPPIGLAEVYAFEPMPDGLTEEQRTHVLGVQGNLWTEHVRGDARAAYMMFPRGAAVAEIGWSPPQARDFSSFARRLAPQIDRMAALGIVGAPSAFVPRPDVEADFAVHGSRVSLSNEVGSTIRYTLDGSEPTARSPRYEAPLRIGWPGRLRAAAFDGDRRLPGALDRGFDAAEARRRADTDLTLCSNGVILALEDDAPATGPRPSLRMNILKPCWIYPAAPLDGVDAIAVTVGQLPFNFQVGADRDAIRFAPPATVAGEIEVRLDDCEGARIAVLPLGPAAGNAALTKLSAPISGQSGTHDLCLTYTADGPNPLWAIESVQLVAP